MIDLYSHVVDIIGAVDGLGGRVYSDYPSRVPTKAPYAIVGEIGNAVDLLSDGEEIIATMTYSVDVFAPARADCRAIVSDICQVAARYGGIRLGLFDGFSESNLARINITLRFRADKRGATFT